MDKKEIQRIRKKNNIKVKPGLTTAQELGKRGGLATKKKYGKEHYRKLQKLSVASKLNKKQG